MREQEKKPIYFDKMRKRRQRLATLKRLVGLSGVIILVFGAIALNAYLVEVGFSTSLEDLRESFGGAGYPAGLPNGNDHIIGNVGKNLTILNDTGLYIYNPRARLIRSVQRLGTGSVAAAAKNRLLTYTPGGLSFSVHSVSRELLNETLEFGVICGDINDNGDFAVVAPVKQFASVVSVKNERFEEIFVWSSPEYVSEVALAPQGGSMAINVISGDGGELQSLIYLFDFQETREKAEIARELTGELTLDVFYTQQERIAVLTDTQYLLLADTNEEERSYGFSGRQILGFERQENNSLLLMREPDGASQSLVLLDGRLNEIATRTLATSTRDIALGDNSIYVLHAGGIDVFDLALEPSSRLERKGIPQIHMAEGQLYYITSDEIRVLSPAEMIGSKTTDDD